MSRIVCDCCHAQACISLQELMAWRSEAIWQRRSLLELPHMMVRIKKARQRSEFISVGVAISIMTSRNSTTGCWLTHTDTGTGRSIADLQSLDVRPRAPPKRPRTVKTVCSDLYQNKQSIPSRPLALVFLTPISRFLQKARNSINQAQNLQKERNDISEHQSIQFPIHKIQK